jgi:hypothetical protein
VGRPTGATRVRRGPRRSRPAPSSGCAGAGRWAVLEGLHPRYVAGISQADDRPAGDLRPADLAGTHRWGEVLRAADPRDRRPAATGRHRRRQRRRLPGARDGRRALRPDRLVQPSRGHRRGHPARLLGAAVRRPLGVGRLPGRIRSNPSSDVAGVRWVGARAGCAEARAPRIHPRVARAQPLCVPGGRRLHGSAAARGNVATTRLERPPDRRGRRASRPRHG